MEDTINVGVDLPTPQQRAMRYLKPLDRASNSSVGVSNDVPASGLVFNATSKEGDRKAEDKGRKRV